MIVQAPAKLNLFLHITGRREDGYHELQSVMQFVALADELEFTQRADANITLRSNYTEVSVVDNLAYRAATLLQQHTQYSGGVDIVLTKRIPVGAGMGGGSSDAATTLLALNKLWGLELSVETLTQLGQTLGADIPFFVRGHAAWVEGIGERLTPITLPQPWYLIVIPPCHVNTHELYQDQQLTRDCQPIRIRDYHVGDGFNVFTEPVCRRYPLVARALDWLNQYQQARMTGSGAVIFAAFDTEQEAGRIAALVPDDLQCVVTRGLNTSPVWENLTQ